MPDRPPQPALHPAAEAPAAPAPAVAEPATPPARIEEAVPVEPAPLEPEPPATLRVIGRVVDGDKEAQLVGAQIELADVVWAPGTHEPRWKRETISAADGTFAVEDAPPSQYWLSVRAEGRTRERLRLDVQEL